MSDVSGPVSTLPGSLHDVPTGAMCDDHPDRPALRRVQGETDSFGAEFLDLCNECITALKAGEAESRRGVCDSGTRNGKRRQGRCRHHAQYGAR
jgi:hypothetical protein